MKAAEAGPGWYTAWMNRADECTLAGAAPSLHPACA
jgi:hypothetical protein